MLIVLFKFQNCAPVSPSQDLVSGSDGEVRIVDRWHESQVSFMSPKMVVPETPSQQGVLGLCVGSVEGQMIEYQVIEISGSARLVSSGLVECVRGGFELPLAEVQFSSCDSRLQVRAVRQGDSQSYAETLLLPECAVGS